MKTLFAIVCMLIGTQALMKPKGISEEMYCLGCEVVVKELDFMLGRKPTRGMGETVTRALARVCDTHNFDKYDVDSKTVLKVCKHIKGDEGMEAVLITEYGRKHATGRKTTYLDMTQMICSTVLKACRDPGSTDNTGTEGGIRYDPETEDFYVTEGSKVRVPHPVNTNDVLNSESMFEVEKDPSVEADHVTSGNFKKVPAEPIHIHNHEEL